MAKEDNRYNAETALITALTLLRHGDTAQALTMAVVAVGRIGSLVPEQVLTRVGRDIGDQIMNVRSAVHG